MNNNEKEQLQKLMQENNVQDNTENIKNRKDSSQIRKDIEFIMNLKKEHPEYTSQELDDKCSGQCFYLFMNYTNIYNMFIKNDLSMDVMNILLKQLENIENGTLDQQEASFEVGKILKQIYVDTQLKLNQTKKNNDEQNDIIKRMKKDENVKNISWKEYKNKAK